MRNHVRCLRVVLFFLVLFSTFVPILAFGQAEYVPESYRVKVDSVDVSRAPQVRISATFLDNRSRPVSPKDIQGVEIYCDEEQVRVSPKVMGFFEGEIPLDLAIILPISTRFSETEREGMKKSFEALSESKRTDNARVAGFFDDGRSINVAPLGEAKKVAELLSSVKPEGQPSFLYSSLDKAMEEMTDPAKMRSPSRRAIILVTDAFDTYTFRSADVQREIRNIHREARANDIKIYVVMFKPFIQGLIPMFEGLSRKTGGTYRYAPSPDVIMKEVESAWGEVVGQLQIEFRMPNAREGLSCEYSLIMTNKEGERIISERYREVEFGELAFNWRPLIITGIVFGVLLIIGLIVFLILRRARKKKAAAKAALDEQILQEKIEKGEACAKCRRTMMADWKECMFCKREAAAEIAEAQAAAKDKAIAEAEKKGIDLNARVCPVCARTLMPQWKECLFCKAGIGAGEDAKKSKAKWGVAPTFGAREKKDPNEGLAICPKCKRAMKAHWDICLYCEADAMNKQVVEEKKAEPEVSANLRHCGECGRAMKAHWDICLYCEANRYKD